MKHFEGFSGEGGGLSQLAMVTLPIQNEIKGDTNKLDKIKHGQNCIKDKKKKINRHT